MLVLRDYQEKIIAETRQRFLQGQKRVLIQLATGGGKTAIASHMIASAHRKNKRVWFICNRTELVDQTAKSLMKLGLKFSFIAAGYNYNMKDQIHVCSIQTLSRRISDRNILKPDMVYWDETRGIAANSWSNVFWNLPESYHVGLDATPCRLSGEPLGDYYQSMVMGPPVRWLMDNGYLCDYKIFAPKVSDFSGLKTRMGDYIASDVDKIVNDKKILGNAVKEYKKHANGKRNLVFCNSILHSKNIRDEFLANGIKAEDIDGTMDRSERAAVLKRFESGETKVLTSVDLVTAGFDLPAIECVTLERPTRSIALAKQMIGRGLRPSIGKEKLIILDHVNMWHSGLPDDEIEWSLLGEKKPKNKTELQVKMCERCYFVFESRKRSCPECGYEKEIKTRNVDIEHTDDNLEELNVEELRKKAKQEQGSAQSQGDLYNLGIKRGYTRSNARKWAKYVFNARQAKKLQRGY